MPRSYRAMNKHWPSGWHWKPWPMVRVVHGMYRSAKSKERVYGYRDGLMRRAAIASGYFKRRPKIKPMACGHRRLVVVPMISGGMAKKRPRRRV